METNNDDVPSLVARSGSDESTNELGCRRCLAASFRANTPSLTTPRLWDFHRDDWNEIQKFNLTCNINSCQFITTFQNIHVWNPRSHPTNVQHYDNRAMLGLQPLDIGRICGRSGVDVWSVFFLGGLGLGWEYHPCCSRKSIFLMHLQMAFFRVHVVGHVIFENPFPVEGMMMNMSSLFFGKDISHSQIVNLESKRFSGLPGVFLCVWGEEDFVEGPCAPCFNNDSCHTIIVS